MYNRIWIACLAVVATACGGDAAPERTDGSTTSPAPVSQEQYRLAQERHADSVLSHLRTAEQLVRDLGAGYVVGEARLRDSLATFSSTGTQEG